MIIKNYDDKGFSPTLPPIQEERTSIYYCRNSKRNKKRYKRNLKRVQRSYFTRMVENKQYDTNDFYEQLSEWYLV